MRETFGTNTIIPIYDNEDSVCGIVYNGTTYYFVKNLQGDVISITNAGGTTLARYSYDAWGKCTIAEDTTEEGIATINPYRYRTYYYDTETGLYYLQSRYYDPETGRFINGDDPIFLGTNGNIASYNLFAYCENDVVNYKDPSGYYAGTLVLSTTLVSSLSSALSGIMVSIGASVAGIKAALVSSWLLPVCIAATSIAMIGLFSLFNRINSLVRLSEKVISSVKAKVKASGIDCKKLGDYTVYVIVRKGTTDIVYVGITKNYVSRKNKHTGSGKRFPKNKYTMLPIATGLSKSQARAMEQTIITAYTLDSLKNMINSISPKKWDNFKREFEQVNTLMQSWVDPE